MKKPFILIVAVALVFLLTACASSRIDVKDLKESSYDAAQQSMQVTLTIDPSSVKAGTETLSMHFENNSDTEFSFGMEPHLDIESGGVWYTVPTAEDAVWIEIAYVLPAGESSDFEFPLKAFYGSLPAGHYRIVKPLYADGVNPFVIGEFTIA